MNKYRISCSADFKFHGETDFVKGLIVCDLNARLETVQYVYSVYSNVDINFPNLLIYFELNLVF